MLLHRLVVRVPLHARGFAAATSNKVKLVFVSGTDGKQYPVIGYVNDTLLDVAKDNDISIEGACGGGMACCTCHVILEEKHYTPPTSEEEEDMLDLAIGLTKTSRLACQIDVQKSMDGMTIRLPAEVKNRQGGGGL